MLKIDLWYLKVPKVELHLHLEGAIPLPALWELVKKYGGQSESPSLKALEERFQFRDFPHFIETWNWKNRFIREYADFIFLAEAVARDLAAQNIQYAEMFYTPSDFAKTGMKTQEITRAVRAGLAKVENIRISLIADFCRDFGPQSAARVVEELNEVKALGVIGVTIGGSEQAFPAGPFEAVYERARQLGFHTSAHAGEAAGPESVWSAINDLKVDRVGHGTRAVEDPRLVDYLKEHRIPVEVCPISNVKTRVTENLKQHPVRQLFDKGLLISINTDDPKMFGNSLAEEYQSLVSELGFSRDDIRQLILGGIRSAWLTDAEKSHLVEEFSQSSGWK